MSDLVLLLALFPFGLSSAGIAISCALFVIKNYKYIISLKNKKFEYYVSLYLIVYPVFLSLISKYYMDLEINLYQLIRKMTPLVLGLLIYFILLNNRKITESFKKNINNIIGILLFIGITSILTKTELYSHQLSSSDNRFFIYSGYFFALATLANFNNKFVDSLKIIPLFTFQKIIYIYYLMEIFIKNTNDKAGKKIFLLLIIIIVSYKMLPRLIHLFKVGDNWRLSEINNAFPQITDSFNHLIFGHGIGFKFQILVWPIVEVYPIKQMLNSQYDIHNLYIDLIFKNGLIYTLIYIYFIYYLCQKIENRKNAILAFTLFLISGFSAPTLSSSIELIGFLSGIAFLRMQNASNYN